jgi:murein DD-endopeptidase MepM/ murein hydrolase activator NlpD
MVNVTQTDAQGNVRNAGQREGDWSRPDVAQSWNPADVSYLKKLFEAYHRGYNEGHAPPPQHDSAPGGSIGMPMGPGFHIKDTFGAPRSGGRTHKGTDISAPKGTPLYAMVSGTVVRSRNSLGGLVSTLRGDDGRTYGYMHLSRYGANGRVKQGQVIGYVGATGNAQGNHLHLSIRNTKTRAYYNPYTVLRQAGYS